MRFKVKSMVKNVRNGQGKSQREAARNGHSKGAAKGIRNWQRGSAREKSRTRPPSRLWDLMLRGYYRLRRRAGLEEIASERLRQQALLYPEADAAAALREEDRKRLQFTVGCLAAVILLTAAAGLSGTETVYTTLTRPGYGEDTSEKVLDLTVEDRDYEIPVLVDSQVYTGEELEEMFAKAWEEAQRQALGDNPDWEHISTDLDFGEETGVPGITVEWNSGDVDVISVDGEIAEPEREDEILETDLTATLIYEEEEQEHTVHAGVIWPELTSAEAEERQITGALEKALADREEEEVELPGSIGEAAIIYKEESDGVPMWLIPVLGICAMAALWMLPEQRRREALTRRDRELALAYSELVWKLTVLLGAGMTVRGAWDRILRSYREKRQAGEPAEVLYEEMQMTWNSMSQGVFEEKAYAQFGRRCGLQPYLRLGSLLETNVRQGRKGLVQQMQNEADAAFRERLQLAKRQGEEASSRLLMPMMLLFGLVLVILMVPALSQFG